MNNKVKLLAAVRNLRDRGTRLVNTAVLRVFGVFDDKLSVWISECGDVLKQFPLEQSLVSNTIEHARTHYDGDALRSVIRLLDDALVVGKDMKEASEKVGLFELSQLQLDTLAVEPRSCFVMMPFSETFDPVFRDSIAPALRARNCLCYRADEVVHLGQISKEIFMHIATKQFCIADISLRNPNVMYELGIAHALGKPSIILTSDPPDRVPFDVAHYKYIKYRRKPLTEDQLHLLEGKINNAIVNMLRM
jgi:hypothetical protein